MIQVVLATAIGRVAQTGTAHAVEFYHDNTGLNDNNMENQFYIADIDLI